MQSKPNRGRIIKIEALRGFAALYVFAGHLVLLRILEKDSTGALIFRFGQEVVMLFFVVSGFAVYFSTWQHDDRSFRPYFLRRFKRIYPIFLLAILISIVLTPELVIGGPGLFQSVGNIFMLQDFGTGKPGVWVSPLGGNTPLWSLSYEWWFYMMFFPIYRFVPVKCQLHIVALMSLVGFLTYSAAPNQASLFLFYFLIWWSGVEIARIYIDHKEFSFHSLRYVILYIVLLTVCATLPVVRSLAVGNAIWYASRLGIAPLSRLLNSAYRRPCLGTTSMAAFRSAARWIHMGGTDFVRDICASLPVVNHLDIP